MHTIENTLFIGKIVHHFEELGSTNEYAVNLISKSNPSEGTVISAYKQTSGRGQIGSKWDSEPGMNLTLSVILYPGFLEASRQFLLTQAIALGVFDCLKAYVASNLFMKWPNDIYHENKKTGGILLQSGLKGSQLMWCVAGIGINVNQTIFNPGLPNPSSLKAICGKTIELEELSIKLCQSLEYRYLQLKRGQIKALQAEYLENCYRFMEEALFERPNADVFSGKIIGVDPSGKLLIAHSKGEEAFGMKEVRFVI